MRGKRYALKVEDGKVSKAYVEPDNTGSAGKWFYLLWLYYSAC
jgi:2-Cys peroxiredoxin 5